MSIFICLLADVSLQLGLGLDEKDAEIKQDPASSNDGWKSKAQTGKEDSYPASLLADPSWNEASCDTWFCNVFSLEMKALAGSLALANVQL